MQVTISADEWTRAVARAREVGAAMGAEQVALVAARAAVEALGVAVPVTTAELDGAAPATRSAVVAGAAEPERPVRDLRVAARQAAAVDGYCAHCATVYGAAALGALPDGNRVCPVHGTVVDDVNEVAEGRYHTTRPAPLGAGPRARTVTRERCGAPVGGHPCGRDAGHDGRHDPRGAV